MTRADSPLEKAKGALGAAAILIEDSDRDPTGLYPVAVEAEIRLLLLIASTQASIAQAEALEAIADRLPFTQ